MPMSNNAVSQALMLAGNGEGPGACVLLMQAGDAGDVDALMQLAIWHLRGQIVDRDLPLARSLLRRAVAIGHVDAALMEIALTANGSGALPDWAHARRLLDTAARSDSVAAEHIAVLNEMRIDATGNPSSLPAPVLLNERPRIAHIPALLTPRECAHVASVAADMLEPAKIIDPRTGQWTSHPVRTSDEAAIGPARENLVVRAINLRIAAATGSDVRQGEALTVLRYQPGQQYRPHLDAIAGAQNQRICTTLVYLNEGYRGGETTFPDLGLSFRARGGDALMFDNLLPDGAPDSRSRHAGMPVTAGAKWIATRWIRAEPIDSWTLR